ncbi:hypothetical protein [Micromonospora sp. KC723]|uniref:hypothetical protein n=1 Tax=Micromonospora sp. KC723 TaxID=2530381 RepID=UPI00140560AD|nr:hypothetical protein [Micromonospora sp. KC723]
MAAGLAGMSFSQLPVVAGVALGEGAGTSSRRYAVTASKASLRRYAESMAALSDGL